MPVQPILLGLSFIDLVVLSAVVGYLFYNFRHLITGGTFIVGALLALILLRIAAIFILAQQ